MEISFSSLLGISISSAAVVVTIIMLITSAIERKKKEGAPTLEDKIQTLTESLGSSLSVISEIESEIESRSRIADKLKTDVARYEQLREINKSQVDAIAQTIRGEITGESRKSLWINAIITFFVALIFFFLGFWLRGT